MLQVCGPWQPLRSRAATLAWPATLPAMARKASACGESGWAATVGMPRSPSTTIAGSQRDAAEEGHMQALGRLFRGALAAEDLRLRHGSCGQTKVLMFSTMPRIGTFMVWNMCSALVAMVSAASCAVVTMTTPVRGTSCARLSWRIAGAGRQVDDQVIQLAPLHVAQQLLHGAGDHRAAPDHRLVSHPAGTPATSAARHSARWG